MKEKQAMKPPIQPEQKQDATAPTKWDLLRERLEKSRLALEGKHTISPQEKKKILRQRAQKLAQAPEINQPGAPPLEIIEFCLAQERYGIESNYVREVCHLKNLTPIPCTPSFVAGITSLRGEIVSIIDLRRFFDLPAINNSGQCEILILRSGQMQFGILADNVLGVRVVPGNKIRSSLTTLTGTRSDYLKGVTDDLLVILDAGKILSDKRLVVHEEINA